MSLDKAKVLKGSPIQINDFIILNQPSVGEVIDFGETRFFNIFYTLCSIPSDMKSILWDAKIDFMEISDWDLFINLSRGMTAEDTSLILGENIDFSKMQLAKSQENEEIVMITEDGKIINQQIYLEFIGIIREMVGYVLKREKAANKATKLALIEEDRMKKRKKSKEDSFISSAIISLVNTEEFPYTYKSCMDITIYQLIKSYYQIQKKKSACALYQGSMSGFVDTSKIQKKNFQWIYTNEN